jgi:hypothetical protein
MNDTADEKKSYYILPICGQVHGYILSFFCQMFNPRFLFSRLFFFRTLTGRMHCMYKAFLGLIPLKVYYMAGEEPQGKKWI